MSRSWAEQYSDEGYYYSSQPGYCQNPHCGHDPIFYRHILRHHLSGEVVEIGTQCYDRWRIAHGLSPIDHIIWKKYIDNLKEAALKQDGQKLSPSEMKIIKDDSIIAMVKRGMVKPDNIPPGVSPDIRRNARIKYILHYCKENNISLTLIRQPLQNFHTIDEADEWAREQGGYCIGTQKIRGDKQWSTFVNPYYRKGQY